MTVQQVWHVKDPPSKYTVSTDKNPYFKAITQTLNEMEEYSSKMIMKVDIFLVISGNVGYRPPPKL